ncbi:MAG: hypothetical protein K2R98_23055 [Gemmataceae bacterium]|nr:hypothetical protein [Gemmataceae bacterium]
MLAIVAVLSLSVSSSFADKWGAPVAQIFASSEGTCGLKILPPPDGAARKSQGRLFSLDPEGKEKPIWDVRLVNIPVRALISDDGKYVATLDTWGGTGFDHSLVVYGPTGNMVADFKLEDLLTQEEIGKHTERSESSRRWAQNATFKFDRDKEKLTIAFNWGKVIRVSVTTGKIEK